MQNTLPISSLINVSVSLSPPAAQSQNLTSLLILGSSDVIDVVTRMRTYSSLAAVSADFGTSAPEFLAASLWFAQSPQPLSLLIGRWAQAATHGLLQGGPESVANQALSSWTGITAGGFHVSIDGGASTNVTGLNFSGATTLPGVAAIIQTGLTTASLAATIVWNANLQCFQLKSNSTGATSSVSFLTAPTTGTDISGLLMMQAASSGAFQANGIVAESALAAATLFDGQFGQQWYALFIIGAADSDHQAVGPFIEGTTTKHFYGVSTQEAGVLASTTTDIAALMQQAKLNKTAVQYSASSPYAVVSLLARILTVDYAGNNTAITLMYKQEPTIVAETLSQTQMTNLLSKNCNVFVNYNNNTAIIQAGTCASGQFIDTQIGADNLAVSIQTATYNLLFLSPNKIPQTDRGTSQIVSVITQVCNQFVNDGYLAPGNWTGPQTGPGLNTGDWMPTGFHVYAPPVSQQTQASRAARLSVPIQVAAKLAGAVHTVSVAITINP